MTTWNLYWTPEGKIIATVEATTYRAAIRKAPQPYRKYLGEIHAVEVISVQPGNDVPRKTYDEKQTNACDRTRVCLQVIATLATEGLDLIGTDRLDDLLTQIHNERIAATAWNNRIRNNDLDI